MYRRVQGFKSVVRIGMATEKKTCITVEVQVAIETLRPMVQVVSLTLGHISGTIISDWS